MSVREYLKYVAEDLLPVVDHICVGNEDITFDELLNEHLNENAVFFNNAEYESDGEVEWQIDKYYLYVGE